MKELLKKLDRRMLDGGDPAVVPLLRIAYACLLLIHILTLWPNSEMWFTDQGVMSSQTAQTLGNDYNWSLLFWLPSTPLVVKCCLVIMFVHSIFLLLGVASRIQVACLFVWLVSFQNRNFLILDGEDTLMRLYAFFFIWLPLDERYSLAKFLHNTKETARSAERPWALRLIQFQIIALYASTALCKLQGNTWHDGTAMWYVSRMTDNFGRLIPASLFEVYWVSAFATWSALTLEMVLPLALLIPQTRKWGVVAGIMLHLGIELSMNLFLFQWFMILGLISFIKVEDWNSLSSHFQRPLSIYLNKLKLSDKQST
jgi:hypothetical protein